MDIKKINSVLKNLNNLSYTYKSVAEDTDYDWEKEGETGTKTTVYDVGDGVFLRIVEEDDSYGNNPQVTEVQFVQPITKSVVDYETL